MDPEKPDDGSKPPEPKPAKRSSEDADAGQAKPANYRERMQKQLEEARRQQARQQQQ
jgi:hypothetical protein